MILSTASAYKKAFNCFPQGAAIALEGHNPILNLPQQLNNLYTAQNLIKVLCMSSEDDNNICLAKDHTSAEM